MAQSGGTFVRSAPDFARAPWGDSLAVRLPKALIEKMGLAAGNEITIVDVAERTLVAQKENRRKATLERMASPTGHFLPITNSIATRPTSGDGGLRFVHPHTSSCVEFRPLSS
jgi:antitoxin component of MazEF toxin-antitoxin module